MAAVVDTFVDLEIRILRKQEFLRCFLPGDALRLSREYVPVQLTPE
jgi:hypothetical protein